MPPPLARQARQGAGAVRPYSALVREGRAVPLLSEEWLVRVARRPLGGDRCLLTRLGTVLERHLDFLVNVFSCQSIAEVIANVELARN